MQRSVSRLKKDLMAVKVVSLVNSVLLCALLVWSFIKPVHSEVTATGGSVDSVISVGDSPETVYRDEVISRAKARGHFTPSEYATFEGIHLRTIYRQLESGSIDNAEKVDGRWKIYCD